jgi:hypothetical protein
MATGLSADLRQEKSFTSRLETGMPPGSNGVSGVMMAKASTTAAANNARGANGSGEQQETAVMLGGGAPTITLTAGALLELHPYLEQKRGLNKPLYFTMAGAGAVVGLVYLAPKDMTARQALENTKNFGISDPIYEMLPVNYKVFAKSGLCADLFNDVWFNLPAVQDALDQSGMSDKEALWSDWLLFLGAMMCPTDVNFFSEGFCEHPSFIENLIDFDKLQAIDPNDICIEINAFCIEQQKLVDFTNYQVDRQGKPICIEGKMIKKRITPDHLRAAMAFPFIYPPYRLGRYHYFEGAAFQCLNDISQTELERIEKFIVLDALPQKLIGRPRNLWDAYALSIIMPTAGSAALGRQLLEAQTSPPKRKKRPMLDAASAMMHLGAGHRVKFAKFKIELDEVQDSWGWSRSSLQRLFEVGRDAGKVLMNELESKRPTPHP